MAQESDHWKIDNVSWKTQINLKLKFSSDQKKKKKQYANNEINTKGELNQ